MSTSDGIHSSSHRTTPRSTLSGSQSGSESHNRRIQRRGFAASNRIRFVGKFNLTASHSPTVHRLSRSRLTGKDRDRSPARGRRAPHGQPAVNSPHFRCLQDPLRWKFLTGLIEQQFTVLSPGRRDSRQPWGRATRVSFISVCADSMASPTACESAKIRHNEKSGSPALPQLFPDLLETRIALDDSMFAS